MNRTTGQPGFSDSPRLDSPDLAAANEVVEKSSSNYSAIELSPSDTQQIEFSPLPPKILPGTIVGGFEVTGELGCGGMSSVYRAHQPSRERTVALKVLSPHLVHLDRAVARFRREAELASRVAHPGILPVFDHGFDGTYHYYAMKLMTEPTLEEFLDGAQGARGEAFFREAASLFAYLCRTVAVLHSSGIVHQDIKPANIFLTRDQRLVLADFGVAREIETNDGEDEDEVRGDGDAMGSPAYMAPERFLGGAGVDVRSDVYSIGMSLFELITGVLPFPRASDEEMARLKLTRKPPSPRHFLPELPLGLEAIVRQALEVHLDLRYRSAIDLARDLERFATNRRSNARAHPGAGGYEHDAAEGTDGPDPQPAVL